MALSQQLLVALAVVLIVGLLLGLVRRRTIRACYSWVGYLITVATAEVLILLWPSVFWTWHFWVGKELLLGLFKLGLGLEIGALAFRRFPGARSVARGMAALTLAGTALLLLQGSGKEMSSLAAVALEAHARLSHATALLLVALGLLVLWYRVPVHRLHRAILRGLATYLLVFSSALRGFVEMLAPDRRGLWEALTRLDGVAYIVMLSYWLWEAWRVSPDDSLRGSAAIEARLAWRERIDGEKQDAHP
ncbi:MAG: hypothetical protein KJ067_13970 [Vicinamibacteria bacterium]|nr:hypothetical protein [Vicinamibacteria bacterium]